MCCNYGQYCKKCYRSWISPFVYSKDWIEFALLFTLWSSLSATTQQVGKAGGLQILRCQGIAVAYYGFTLDALTLKPSDFCNVGVETEPNTKKY